MCIKGQLSNFYFFRKPWAFTKGNSQRSKFVLLVGLIHCLLVSGDLDSVSILLSLLAHLSQRLRGELIVYRSSRRPSVCASVRLSVFGLAGNDNKHESFDEFEIRLDPNTGFHGNR